MRFFTKEVYLVTGNENKLREFREILGIDIEMIDKLLSRRMDMEKSVFKKRVEKLQHLMEKNKVDYCIATP